MGSVLVCVDGPSDVEAMELHKNINDVYILQNAFMLGSSLLMPGQNKGKKYLYKKDIAVFIQM